MSSGHGLPLNHVVDMPGAFEAQTPSQPNIGEDLPKERSLPPAKARRSIFGPLTASIAKPESSQVAAQGKMQQSKGSMSAEDTTTQPNVNNSPNRSSSPQRGSTDSQVVTSPPNSIHDEVSPQKTDEPKLAAAASTSKMSEQTPESVTQSQIYDEPASTSIENTPNPKTLSDTESLRDTRSDPTMEASPHVGVAENVGPVHDAETTPTPAPGIVHSDVASDTVAIPLTRTVSDGHAVSSTEASSDTSMTPEIMIMAIPGVMPASAVASGGEATPVEAIPAEVTPTETVPTEGTPAEAIPAEVTPTETAPTEGTPAEATLSETTPVKATPIKAMSVDAAEAMPTRATSAKATPTKTTPTEATPVEATPVEATPVEAMSVDAAEAMPTGATSAEATPTETTPTEAPPVEAMPASQNVQSANVTPSTQAMLGAKIKPDVEVIPDTRRASVAELVPESHVKPNVNTETDAQAKTGPRVEQSSQSPLGNDSMPNTGATPMIQSVPSAPVLPSAPFVPGIIVLGTGTASAMRASANSEIGAPVDNVRTGPDTEVLRQLETAANDKAVPNTELAPEVDQALDLSKPIKRSQTITSVPDIQIHSPQQVVPLKPLLDLEAPPIASSASSVALPLAPHSSPALSALQSLSVKLDDVPQSLPVGNMEAANMKSLPKVPGADISGLPTLSESTPPQIDLKGRMKKRRRIVRRAREMLVRRRLLAMLLGKELGGTTYYKLRQLQDLGGQTNLPTAI